MRFLTFPNQVRDIVSLVFGLFLAFFHQNLTAQDFARLPIEVLDQTGKSLSLGFTGGWNSPQFSLADLDADGAEELVVFERLGNRFTTFKRDATAPAAAFGWKYWPEGINSFPDSLSNWAIVRDLDGDGASDLFCGSNSANNAVDGYRGSFKNGRLAFEKMRLGNGSGPFSFLFFEKQNTAEMLNVIVAYDDYPAMADVTGDGDLDFITFNPGGGYVEHFENMAIERGFGADTIILKLRDNCFGKFYENGLSKTLSLSATPFDCSPPFGPGPLPVHPGSTQVMLDFDGDGDLEIVLGDISFPNFVMPKNCGSTANYWACEQDSLFPLAAGPTLLPNFPCPFFFDLDGDGAGDFVGASNGGGIGTPDRDIWFYKNLAPAGAALDLVLKTKSAMVDEMFDLGTGARPATMDVDADGLMDLVVGNYGDALGAGKYVPRLVFLRNIGTGTAPKFKIQDNDWLNFSQFQTQGVINLSPAFGDLDLDGDLDLLVGEDEGQFFFCENLAGFGEPLVLGPIQIAWLNMDVDGRASTPFIIDLDGDGKNDIVSGERKGNLNFWKNKTAGPGQPVVFSAVADNGFFGSVTTAPLPGVESQCAPTFFETTTGEVKLLVGTNDPGRMRLYKNVKQTAPGSAFDLETADFGRLREGFRQHAAVADLDKDGVFDLVVGNLAGGLSFFRSNLKTDGSAVSSLDPDWLEPFSIQIFPNPASEKAELLVTEKGASRAGEWRLFDLFGRQVSSGKMVGGRGEIDLTRSASGIYVVEMLIDGRRAAKKLVKN